MTDAELRRDAAIMRAIREMTYEALGRGWFPADEPESVLADEPHRRPTRMEAVIDRQRFEVLAWKTFALLEAVFIVGWIVVAARHWIIAAGEGTGAP